MKKNIIKTILLSFIITAFISCNENDNEKNIYSGSNFISFGTVTSASALESANGAITITAYASVANLSSDITVDVDISAETGSSANYTIVNGKSNFVFSAGKYVDEIQIMPIDNFDEDGDKIIKFTLSAASDGSSLGLPGPDSNGKVFTVTFEDDDCAFTIQGLGDATWSGMDNAPASQAGPNESQVTTSSNGTDLFIEGLSYGWMTDTAFWDEVIVDSFKVTAVVDPITGAITIAKQPLCTTTWNGAAQPPYFIEATGQFVSCSKTMTISYDLLQGADIASAAVLRSFTETLTMN